jgi:hypothetical protein
VTRWIFAALIVPAVAMAASPARAGCDLARVVGYTLVASKGIDSYVQDGKRVRGFTGCNRDRVLVFTDNTGVRCADTAAQRAELPTAFLFARGPNDMKLCVGDALFDVAPAR